MKKSIIISIPEPCHEDWAKMTATEKGKFCSVCTKEVIDFTSKTDEELVKILTANKNTCGRVKKSQLNREVKFERKSGQSFAPFAASMLLPLTLFSNNPKSENNSIPEKPMVSIGIGRFNTNNFRLSVFSKGTVRDENGNPIKNVEIISNETETRTWTNKNGEYEIYTLDKEILTFIKDRYETIEIAVGNSPKTMNVLLNSQSTYETSMLGNIAYIPEEPIKKDSLFFITKGNVTDDTGLPILGVTVFIKGTKNITQSDFDGNYEIETKPNDVLVLSYVGFETKEITVSNIPLNVDVNLIPGCALNSMLSGGISFENYEEYQPSKDQDWYEKSKQAYKNTVEFMKIKQERRKAERKAKRKNK